MTDFAWTPGAGAYKHYPPYVNLTGNRLTVRGAEDLSGAHPQMGATVSIDLPADQLALLAIAAATQRAKTPKAVECEASQSGPKGIAPNSFGDTSHD